MKNTKIFAKNKLLLTLLVTAFGFLLVHLNTNKIFAATRTWDADFNQQWLTPENWDGDTLPDPGDDLIFPSSAFFITVDCDSITDTYSSLTFADNYNMSCTSLHVTNGVAVSGNNSVDFQPQLILEGDVTISTSSSTDNINFQGISLNSHNLTFDISSTDIIEVDGVISGSGNVTKYGGGYVYFENTNTFTGNLHVSNGNLLIDGVSATGNAANAITIGDGFFNTAILSSLNTNSVNTASTVEIRTSGEWKIGFATPIVQDINQIIGPGKISFALDSVLNINPTADFTYTGTFTDSGEINLNENVGVTFSGNSGSYTGNVNINDGILYVDGNFMNANFTLNNHYLAGSGTVGTIAGTGFVSPGHNDYSLFQTGSNIVTLPSTITFAMQLDGTSQNTDYDQIVFGNDTNLNNSTLSLNLGFAPSIGDTFDIFGTSSGSILGQFNGLADGAIINVSGYYFRINYSPTSVTLTTVALADNTQFLAFPPPVTSDDAFDILATWVGSFGTPTGTAELFNGATSLGTVTLINGDATFHFLSLPAGNYNLTLHYSGDGTYPSSISNVLSMTINQGTITQPNSQGLSNTGINLPVNLIAIGSLLSLFGIVVVAKRINYSK